MGGKEGRWNTQRGKAGTGGHGGEADEGWSEDPAESDHVQLPRGQQSLCPSASQCLHPEDLLGIGTIHTGAHQWHKRDKNSLLSRSSHYRVPREDDIPGAGKNKKLKL